MGCAFDSACMALTAKNRVPSSSVDPTVWESTRNTWPNADSGISPFLASRARTWSASPWLATLSGRESRLRTRGNPGDFVVVVVLEVFEVGRIALVVVGFWFSSPIGRVERGDRWRRDWDRDRDRDLREDEDWERWVEIATVSSSCVTVGARPVGALGADEFSSSSVCFRRVWGCWWWWWWEWEWS